ncbi:MAG: CoA transferase [Caulobacteraceae bacterium]|nr:CoA transferase [Caulobacteraceae bacterium]
MTDGFPSPASGPLAGIRILEFDAIGPVPLAAMILADMGAEVVRLARRSGGAWAEVGGTVLNRGRPHVSVDLKSPEDIEQVLALIDRADALIEGSRPGVMERLGLGPEVCHARNPRLVYARMTGWGQTGPLAQRAGHDINYIALTGALHAMGAADAPPPVPLNLVGDYGGGAMFAVAGLLAAILGAKATGRGQVVDVAMTDGVAALTAMFHGLAASGMWSPARGSNLLDGSKPFYRCYACADGKFVAVGALEPQFFAALLAGLDVSPDRFSQYDPSGWPEMEAVFAERFAGRTRDDWAEAFAGTDACVSPVLDFAEAPAHPHNAARETFVEIGGIVQPAPAPRFDATVNEAGPEAAGERTFDDIRALWRD